MERTWRLVRPSICAIKMEVSKTRPRKRERKTTSTHRTIRINGRFVTLMSQLLALLHEEKLAAIQA